MLFSRYLYYFVFVIPSIILFIVGFNYLVDPFALHDTPLIEGVNVKKPFFSSHLRMSKAAAIRRYKPTSIVLGSSRGEHGIDPEHPGWGTRSVYNMSLGGANLYESFRYLQHAHAIQPLQQIVLMLDFFMFNAEKNPNKQDFSEERLAFNQEGHFQLQNVNDTIASLVSLDALSSSIETITKQRSRISAEYLTNGMIDSTHKTFWIWAEGGHRSAFLGREDGYFNHLYDSFSFNTPQLDNWEIYQKLLIFSWEHSIDLIVVVSPTHVRLFEVIAVKGLWSYFEQWKRLLVSLNEEIAFQHSRTPYPLWDFSGYNYYTIEPVPTLGDRETAMQWYWESSHYKKELGDLVLDRIFNYIHPERTIVDGFGIQLTSNNIESHLQQIRNDRQHWRDSHTNDVAEIEALQYSR
jgi:hypothetical protein